MEEVTEEDRLAALYALEILDTGPSESFDRLTSILCRVLDMPIALVCLVDKERQWFKSNAGLEGTSETPRNVAFCHHAIDSNAPEVMVVHDASKDSRFKDNPLVTGPPYIRFYAGAPIKMKDVNSKVVKLGTACVIDQKPRPAFNVKDKQLLLDMASIVADELELIRGNSAANSARINEEQQRYITCTAHDLRTPLTVFKLATTMFKDYFKERKALREARSRKAAEKSAKHAAAAAAADADPRTIARRSRENDLIEALDQADVAVDMMEETVCNAIDSARARWVKREATTATTGGGGMAGGGAHGSEKLPSLNVKTLIDSCQQLHNRHHGEEVSVSVAVDEEVPSEVSCDGPVLKRVLVNLITNAFKHATPAEAAAPPHHPAPLFTAPTTTSISGTTANDSNRNSYSGSTRSSATAEENEAATTTTAAQAGDGGESPTLSSSSPPKNPLFGEPLSLLDKGPDEPPPPVPRATLFVQSGRNSSWESENSSPSTSIDLSASNAAAIRASFKSRSTSSNEQAPIPEGSFPSSSGLPLPTSQSASSTGACTASLPPSNSTYSAAVTETCGQVLIRARIVESPSAAITALSAVPSVATMFASDSHAPPRWLRVEVHDNGQGVAPELQNKLFAEAFVGTRRAAQGRESEDGSGRGGGANIFVSRQGSGLGLFVVNVCAQDLQGACGFNCANGSHGFGQTRDGRPWHTGAPLSEPSLGGSVFWFDVPLVDGEQDAEAGSIDRGSYLYYSPDEAEEAAADAAVEGGSGLLGLVTPELLKAMHAGARRVRTHTSGSTNTTGSGASAGSGGRRSGGGESMTSSIDSGGGSMDLNLPFASMSTTSTSDGEACIPCAFEQMGQVFGAGGGGGGVGAARGGGGGGSSPTLTAGRTTSSSPITRTGSLQTPSGPSLHSKGSRGRRAVSGRSDRSDGSEVDTWLEEEDEVEEGSAGRVLVVDDSVMVQKLLVAALTRQNFEVETAKNGREALEKMMKGSEPYLVVLMDFLMPVLDGITATAMYRQWESTVLRGGSNRSRGGSGGSGAAAEVGGNVPSETSSCSSNSGGSSGSHADHAASLTSLGSTDSWEPLPIMRLKRQTIIGISANAESADVETAKRAGLDHFLSKPVKVAQIVEYIKTIG